MCWFQDRAIPRTEDSSVLLTLPDVRQLHGHDCGEAAIKCVLGFHRVTAVVRLATPTHGTDPGHIEAALRNFGFGVTAGEMTVEDLKHYCDTFRPVICLVHWPTGSDSHFLTVRGVSRRTVYFNDPFDGPGKVSAAEFEAAWKGQGRVGMFNRWAIVPWMR